MGIASWKELIKNAPRTLKCQRRDVSKTKGMSYDQECFSGKRKDIDINEGQRWASHDIGPTSPKPSSPTKRSGSRILRGYCGAREFVTQAHFILGPKAQAEEGYSWGHTMKVQIALRHSRGWLCPWHPQGAPKAPFGRREWNGMEWNWIKGIFLEYSSLLLFGSFNGGNRMSILLFGSLSGRKWNG